MSPPLKSFRLDKPFLDANPNIGRTRQERGICALRLASDAVSLDSMQHLLLISRSVILVPRVFGETWLDDPKSSLLRRLE